MKTFVAYYRVSTQKQGASGLGLESQKEIVARHTGGNIVAEFTEIESGAKSKKDDRPQLYAAMDEAIKHGATLVIANLSRLSRNAAFTLSLMESGVDFVCCDMPAANTLTIGIMAIINQETRRQISENTKNALQAYKARGGTLGTPANLTDACRAESLRVRRAATKTKMDTVKQVAELLKDTGLTLQGIAARLNGMGEFRTSRGCAFTPTAVKRLLGK